MHELNLQPTRVPDWYQHDHTEDDVDGHAEDHFQVCPLLSLLIFCYCEFSFIPIFIAVLVTLLVCPALILYGHHLETRERKGKGGVAKPGSLRRTMKQAEAEMKAKKRD